MANGNNCRRKGKGSTKIVQPRPILQAGPVTHLTHSPVRRKEKREETTGGKKQSSVPRGRHVEKKAGSKQGETPSERPIFKSLCASSKARPIQFQSRRRGPFNSRRNSEKETEQRAERETDREEGGEQTGRDAERETANRERRRARDRSSSLDASNSGQGAPIIISAPIGSSASSSDSSIRSRSRRIPTVRGMVLFDVPMRRWKSKQQPGKPENNKAQPEK